LGFDREHHHPAVADGAELVGEQIGRDVAADGAVGLRGREDRREDLAEAGVSPPLDDRGGGGFVSA
jgi:hypothetical protein